ncbi:cilia- and flagella-associated protein 47 isoform X2 [Xenopus laevis]|uniref:Cilia- and flagella-associated protein 47 isoform X2 n=1 Tax=Xenopus laevis TaxID=8355 RepID=A0A8J1M9B1_XENLA|nr:cilia- and flagella-associated protein 47 isoform X2 [Xenopus laevis]
MEDLLDNVLGVRVSPSLLHFMDTLVGKSYKASLVVQNISPQTKTIRIQGPEDPQFTFTVQNPDKPIACGLQITATVEYRPSKKEDIRDRLLVFVDQDVINIPLLGFTPSCYLEVDSEVNFGNIVANSKVIYKEIAITNHGSSPGTFRIKYTGHLPITLDPSSGTVEPKTKQLIQVEICTDKPTLFEEVAKVKLQGSDEVLVKIKGNIVYQVLRLLDVSGKSLDCLHFGSLYFGTSAARQAVIYNDSPETMHWVSVLDDSALGVEMGTDFEQSTDAALQKLDYRRKSENTEAARMISCLPNQGVLLPFQKTNVTICFSPKQINEDLLYDKFPPQQDYALFIRFEPIGSKDGFLQSLSNRDVNNIENKKQHVELAVTGSGVPVALSFNPGTLYNFKECFIGEQIDVLCSLQNESQCLPVVFSFCKISHFHISPAKGKIEPGHSQDVMLTFSPHQVGTFKLKQVVDVLGPTTEDYLPPIKTKVFHQKTLTFMAVCSPVTKKIVMKINPGITPKISNATGQFLAASKETAMYTGNTSVAALNSSKTHIHNHQKKDDNEELVAFPNDRAASIRPSDSSKKYRTIFTKVERYNYVDPDYAYTDEEEKLRKSHKDYYVNYIQCIREERLKKEKEREFEDVNNPIDIGITPAAGLVSPSPSIVERFNEPQKPKTHSSLNGRILTTRQLAAGESRSLSRETSEGINATPCTATEKEDCSLTLTPQQLHHVVVGPSTIDFGEVCVRSTSVRELQIINSLHSYIWVQLQIDFDELQQTGPISHIVPPMSKTEVPIVFETNTFGKFKKSVTYTVNGKHSGHILITAKAVPVALELSSNEIVLTPNSNFLSEKGLRSSVRLYNRRNHPAEFNWKPIITEKGIAFSIRPARGTVDAYKDLECEVVWHPGFGSPDIGEFNLCVLHGNTLKLKCTAELGSTNIQFTEQRVLFAEAPLGLTTYKTAILQNTGLNHAYFQVEDVNPLPGMTVTPSQGVVPIGGYATLQIFFTPEAVMKFDTRLDVSVRNTKPLELRIGGFVIPPQIEISVSSFLFPGVYANSTQVIPFVLQNKSVAHAKVEFDLSKYQDFSMTFKDGSAVENNPLYPLLYIVELEEKESLECSLHFNPKEVAAYDFELPININFTGDLNAGSSVPVTPTSSEKHLVTPRPQIVNVVTPKCRINATVLLPLLSFSTLKLEFDLSSGFLDLGIADDSLCSQEIELTNISKKNVTWKFNLDRAEKKIDDGIFKFSKHSGTLEPGQKSSIAVNFCPSVPGGYFAEIQVILNNNPDSHYTLLHLHGIVRKPRLLFNPPLVILTPVPLDTETQAIVDITALDFSRKSMLKCECPQVELDSGELARPFSIEFPNGQTVSSAGDRSEKLICQISFKSSSPISCLVNLLFTDGYNNQFPLQVSAVAENCILTVYPYLAYHRTDQQVILRSAHNGNGEKGYGTGEAILRPCYIPETPSQSTSSSSLGAATSSTYEESISEDENTLSNERLMSGEREGEYGKNKDVFELSLYPEEYTDEWLFFQNVLAAVRTWFSIFGWPSGCNPITIPQSMWSVCKVHMKNSKGNVAKTINLGKQTKTIYDMLLYLSGQMLPGITASQSLPSNPTERVLQLHWQHATFLTFLRNQGASLPYIKPEFLFEPLDYERWLQVQVQIKELQNLNKKNMDKQAEIKLLEINSSTFQSLSKRVWMDILLQIYKVLILSRVTQKKRDDDYVSETMPKINSEPLSSNIYSPSERILLTWLNVNYEKMRKTVWKDCQKGEIPPTRWIINFDRDLLDGLVLAAQMASYCPFLISTHFTSMYTNPESPEECLHNCLILVSAFRSISLDIDVQATDICDPNPVMMLMLCVYLHEKLPLYLPKKTVMFDGALHEVVSKEVCLKNPSSKPLVYNATIIGRESDNFFLPKGNTIMIAPKNQATLTLEYKSLHLDPAEATLFLVSSSANGINGTTLAFSLQPRITGAVPSGLYKHESPLYELKKIDLAVHIPIKTRGKFRVILVESTSHLSFPDNLKEINHLKKEEAHSLLENASTKVIGETYNEEKLINQVYHPSSMCQFFCPVNSIFLKEGSSTSLQIYYIPFDLGKRFCTIIFSNEMIGDFIYQIEGTGIYPLPSAITALNSQNILQTSTSTPGHKNAQKSMLFKCHPDEILEENLIIPLVNEARERALGLAAQMQMTDLEYKRRKITATLQSSSVRVAVVTQGMSKIQTKSLFSSSPFSKKLTSIDYDVEISMPECFTVPKNISLSVTGKSRVKGSPTGVVGDIIDTENRGLLPLQFKPSGPGRYPCQILLRSSYDARVYMIECVVNPARPERELEFITPACEAVIQDIPIQNSSKQDWKMKVVLEGDYFYGPPFLFIPAGETAQYSLTFKPISQCLSLGRLLLQNETDGTEHIFSLRGTGQESLALDHIIINCQVRQIAQKVLLVPNYTNNILTFNVASDISIIGGAQTITVKPGTSAPYTLNVSPWKRGSFQGVISFVADDGEEQHFQHGISTGCTDDERFLVMDTAKTAKKAPYKVWFSLEIKSNPAPPDKSIEVSCPVLGNVCIDIPMSNPTSEVQHFHVLVDGFGLSGEADFTLQARETFPYMLTFSPTRTGVSTGSVIFQSDIFGEFWYGLQLLSERPSATTLPEVHCELGKWERFCISLKNTTQEIIELKTVNNNPEHFLVEVEPKKPLLLPPNTTTDVTVQFYPSALGKGNHKGSIIFKNPQIEEWIFHMSGVGLIPQPMEPASISARVGSLSSIIITFKNPTDEHVLIDVILTDQEQTMHRLSASVLRHSINTEPAFCLPLKQTQGIPLAPKEKLDIPVLFAPDSMKLYEALVVIHMTKANGDCWAQDISDNINTELKSITRTEKGEISGIRWIYPVHGIPEALPSKSAPAVVMCPARSRTEERVEVLLTGAVPGPTRMPTSHGNRPTEKTNTQDEVQVTNGLSTTEEFFYEIGYESDEVKSQLEPSVAIELVRKERDATSGIVTLFFNIIFAPNKSMRHTVTLMVQCATGGVWKFPIHLVATKPTVDDVIQIDAVGLNKESIVGFRLSSQTRHPEPFNAYFVPGSDTAFSVLPQAGELLPLGTAGTLITVGFKPTMYSKKHKATLVVQTSAMQWTYEIKGLTPKSTPLTNISPKISSMWVKQPTTGHQRNFIQENLKLTATAVSSPIKGSPLFLKTK